MKLYALFLIIFLNSFFINAEDFWGIFDLPNSPEAREGASMVKLPDGRILVFG